MAARGGADGETRPTNGVAGEGRPTDGALGETRPTNLMGWIVPQAQSRWLAAGVAYYTPQRCEQLFRQALAGDLQSQWEMFDLMEATWPELSTCLGQLKDAVVAQGIRVVPFCRKGEKPSATAIERAALVQECIDSMRARPEKDENDFEDSVRDLLDARAKGISVLEIDWEYREQSTVYSPQSTVHSPQSTVHSPQSTAGSPESTVQSPQSAGKSQQSMIAPRCTRWVHPLWYGYPHGPGSGDLMLRPGVGDGDPKKQWWPGDTSVGYGYAWGSTPDWQEFPENKFVIGICKNKTGHPLGSAMLHVLSFWWSASNFCAEWFLNFAQVFGQPVRWATYNPNMTPGDQFKLQAVLTNMGASAWGMFPEGTTFELKDIAKSAGDNAHVALMEMANKVCRLMILRQTLTSDVSGSGSRALGEVHERVLGGVEEALGKWVCKTLQQMVRALMRLNYGDEEECPSLVTGMDEEASPEELAQMLVQINQAGLEPTEEALVEISERLGVTVQRRTAQTFTEGNEGNQGGNPKGEGRGAKENQQPKDEDEDEEEVAGAKGDGGSWITINGNHIFIKDGESVDDAVAKLSGEKTGDGPNGTREKVTDKKKLKKINIDEAARLMKQRGYEMNWSGSKSAPDASGKWVTSYEFKDSTGKSHHFSGEQIKTMISAGRGEPVEIDEDPAAVVAGKRAEVLGQAYRGAMAPFRQIILESKSREECLTRLARAYADWEPKRLVIEMEEALQLCAAAGAADVKR
jgi:phage gp29-like protein